MFALFEDGISPGHPVPRFPGAFGAAVTWGYSRYGPSRGLAMWGKNALPKPIRNAPESCSCALLGVEKISGPGATRCIRGISFRKGLLRREGLAIWVLWPVLSERGTDGHGRARTNTDGMVREYAILQDPPSVLELAVADEAPENDNSDADTEGVGVCVARRAGWRSIMEFLITMPKPSKRDIKST